MRIGGDDPDERSKHGGPRQQDLTQQQPPPQSPPQSQKKQLRKDPRQQQFHPEPGSQVDAPRQEPAHERQELGPNQEPEQSNEFECKTMHQQLMMDWGKRPRVVESGSQKMETDQVPESDS